MADDGDYRLYFEECMRGIRGEMRAGFEGIHIEMNTTKEKTLIELSAIKEQTIKTNNRVTHLEDQRDEYLKTRVSTEMLGNVEKEVKEIRNDLLEYHFFKKYPKVFIGIVLVMIITMFGGFGMIFNAQKGLKTEVDMINSPVKSRDGTITWWPSGVVIDSLNKEKE